MPSHLSLISALAVTLALGVVTAPLGAAQDNAAGAAKTGPLYRFVNQTNAFGDGEIFWSLNGGKEWKTIASDPTVPCPHGNGRLYVAFGKTPKNVGDRSAYWDFIEYASNGPESWAGNTTQVDAFCAPITIAMGDKRIGMEQPRDELFALFREQAPGPFKECVKGDFWIVSPALAAFGTKGSQARYFDAYIDAVWAMYAQEKPTPSGKWTGKVVDGALTFTPVGNGKTYTCSRKPTTQEALLGTGALATNPRFCAAINRHVLADPAEWDKPTGFYQQEPCNWYAKFLHEHSVGGRAYGFCYDDDADQAAFFMTKGKEVVVTFHWARPDKTGKK